MKEKRIAKWIIDYLNGDLDPAQDLRFFRILEEQGYNLDELKKLEKLNTRLEEISSPEPDKRMHGRFYNMLEEQKSKREKQNHPVHSLIPGIGRALSPGYVYRLSYALLLLLAGWVLGYWIIPL